VRYSIMDASIWFFQENGAHQKACEGISPTTILMQASSCTSHRKFQTIGKTTVAIELI
jgi:hypothetical protein